MDVESKIKLGSTKKKILAGLAAGAIITVSVMAPNAVKIFKPILKKYKNGKYNFWRSLQGLEKQGLVERDKGGRYFVSEKGRILLLTHAPDILSKTKRWDGKWRVIIFDIPDAKRKSRDKLRYILLAQGFLLLQKSVWIYPYPCEELITLMKSEMRLGKDLLYMVVEGLEGDSYIKNHFKL